MNGQFLLPPKFPGFLAVAFAAIFIILSSSADAQITDPVVLNNGDSGAGSLRQAIADAADGSTITFDDGLSGEVIRLASSELTINKNLTIDGSSLSEPVTISGDQDMSGTPTPGDRRVFHIAAGGYSVYLYSLVITGGYESGKSGGGIFNDGGNLVIQNTTITNNHAPGGTVAYGGGGIFQNGGMVTVVNSTISYNQAGSVVKSSSGNATGGPGGGIFLAGGTLVVQNSTITGNFAGSASHSAGDATGGRGGGIYHFDGTLTVESSTIVDNFAGDATASGTATGGSGGGIYVRNAILSTTLGNSIVAGNVAGSGADSNGTGPDIRQGNSLIGKVGKNFVGNNDTVDVEFPAPTTPGEPNAGGDLVGTPGAPLSPQLQPLADNGGRTMTLMPYFDSIVVNAGVAADRPQDTTDINWNLNVTELLPIDQIGVPRVSGDELDLGAVEYQFPDLTSRAKRKATLSKIKKTKKALKIATKGGKKAAAMKLKKELKKLKKDLAKL